MSELFIVKYLKEHGLEKTLNDFNLKHKEYPHKILFKYDQIESSFSHKEVREARGLVLEKGTWKVMSMSFEKFFNYGEGRAPEINWDTAKCFAKLDGTLIHSYHDWITGDMCFGTTGTAEGEGAVDNFHYTKSSGTFSDLFLQAYEDVLNISEKTTFKTLEEKDKHFTMKSVFANYRGFTLTFELCTPYNIVVTPHTENTIYLLGARRLDTLEEVPYEMLVEMSKYLRIPLAPVLFEKSNIDELKSTFLNMPYSEEGYVVCDDKFNRVKIKNPAYLAIHFFRDATAFWRIIDIVRGGEDNVNEFKVTFPARGEEAEYLQDTYKKKFTELEGYANEIIKTPEYKFYKEVFDIDPNERNNPHKKNLALKIIGWCKEHNLSKHSGFLFSLVKGQKDIKKYLMECDGKELYTELIKIFKK